LIRVAQEKWSLRSSFRDIHPNNNIEYGYNNDSILISWYAIKINNILFSNCPEHPETLLTQTHLKEIHRIFIELDIPKLLKKGKIIKEALKNKEIKRKSRYQSIITKEHDKQKKNFKLLEQIFKSWKKVKPVTRNRKALKKRIFD